MFSIHRFAGVKPKRGAGVKPERGAGVKPERGAGVCVFPRVAHHTGIRDFMDYGKCGEMRTRFRLKREGLFRPGREEL